MQSSTLKVKVVGLLVSAGLFAGGMLAAPTAQNALQAPSEVDVQATLTAMENRIAGLESRVTLLENQGVGAAEPTVAPTEVPVVTHTLKGSLTIFLSTSKILSEGAACSGDDSVSTETDYTGFHKGTRITIADASSTVIATGEFTDGTVSYDVGTSGNIKFDMTECTFGFEIANIPDLDFYNITIDGFSDSIDFSKAELEEINWTLTLG